MRDTIITFETAKLAKQKSIGKKLPGTEIVILTEDFAYDKEGTLYNRIEILKNFKNLNLIEMYNAYTQTQLQKILREEHNIFVSAIPYTGGGLTNNIDPDDIKDNTLYSVYIHKGTEFETSKHDLKTYEDALEDGLIKGLNCIKKEDSMEFGDLSAFDSVVERIKQKILDLDQKTEKLNQEQNSLPLPESSSEEQETSTLEESKPVLNEKVQRAKLKLAFRADKPIEYLIDGEWKPFTGDLEPEFNNLRRWRIKE